MFFTKTRHIFGTHILSMKPQNVLRFSKGLKFHYSQKVSHYEAQLLNSLTQQNNLLSEPMTEEGIMEKETCEDTIEQLIEGDLVGDVGISRHVRLCCPSMEQGLRSIINQ